MRSSPRESLPVTLLLAISFHPSALHMVWLSIGRRFEALSNSFFHISHEKAFVWCRACGNARIRRTRKTRRSKTSVVLNENESARTHAVLKLTRPDAGLCSSIPAEGLFQKLLRKKKSKDSKKKKKSHRTALIRQVARLPFFHRPGPCSSFPPPPRQEEKGKKQQLFAMWQHLTCGLHVGVFRRVSIPSFLFDAC